LRRFALPGGPETASGVVGVRLGLRGELRASPRAPWVPFTADETIGATRSSFRWEARLRPGPAATVTVVDMYEHGRGRAGAGPGDAPAVVSAGGPDLDRGELQRYLAEIVCCPPALLNHPSLEWAAIGPNTLQIRDCADLTGATVALDLGDDGCPAACRADRPRLVGGRSVVTPWSGAFADPHTWDGLRVPTRLEGTWRLSRGPFTYVCEEVISLYPLRPG
jgi:hypothetical protein